MTETSKQDGYPISSSPGFASWLSSQGVSLAVSTYQTGKLILIGSNPKGGMSVFERNYPRPMGLFGDGQSFLLATKFQIWRFENVLDSGQQLSGYDRSYVPLLGYTTGALNVHDIGNSHEGEPAFVCTRFNCLATISQRYNFKPIWMPKFISKLCGEDRCHLNGLAMVEGRAKYVTACAVSDVDGGWRKQQDNGGVVIDIETNEIVADGFSMPHSPRWHQGKIWLLDSGNGYFGFLDPGSGKFEKVTFCPGFARGLAFVGDYAVINVSLARHSDVFQNLSIQSHLEDNGVEARCGIIIVHLATGKIVESVGMKDPIRELYDVLVLDGVKRPRLVGFESDEITTVVWAEPKTV